jgi:glutathione peroxidase
MKNIVILLLLSASGVLSGIYDISFAAADGKVLNMSQFKGTRILVSVCNAKSTDEQYLRYLNGLQTKVKNLQVIVIPGLEFQGQGELSRANSMKLSEKMRLIVGQPSWVSRMSGEKQHPLLSWLTNDEMNGHFDVDVSSTEQLFVVNDKGDLVGVFDSRVSEDILMRILK